MKEQASALDRICSRLLGAVLFGFPVSLLIISVLGSTNEFVDFGFNERWIGGIMILCVGFGFVFNVIDVLADLVKTKVDGEQEKEKK